MDKSKSTRKHWDSIFSKTQDSMMGWYEQDPKATFDLLNQIQNWQDSTFFISGAGTSILIDELLTKNTKLILNDISREALSAVKQRLGKQAKEIVWLCQDISKPIETAIPAIDIWIDRAVLHFLIDEENIQGYFNNLKTHLAVGGYALFAEFSQKGAEKCAGLPIHQYSIEELSKRLGTSFKLLSSFDYTFINPHNEERAYIYALFQHLDD